MINGELILIDEVLTPDSSRFWPKESYMPGSSPLSFDKQFVRDYLETLDWDKTYPGPTLPDEIFKIVSEVIKIIPGNNVGMGKDHSIFSVIKGKVEFKKSKSDQQDPYSGI